MRETVLCLLSALFLTACGGDPSPAATSDTDAATEAATDTATGDVASDATPNTPDPPLGAPPVVPHSIALASGHGCVLVPDGVKCFGTSNVGGFLGPTKFGEGVYIAPQLVPGLGDAVEVAVGYAHSCARHSDGSVSCWGQNNEGALGAPADKTCGSTPCRPTPAKVAGLPAVVRLVARNTTTCTLLADGTVRCFGAAFGYNATGGGEAPRTLPFAENLVDIDFAEGGLCGVTTASTVRCFDDITKERPAPWAIGTPPVVWTGVKQFARNGAGTSALIGEKIAYDRGATPFSPVAQLAGYGGDGRFQCVRLVAGTVRCWGEGDRLGTGRPVPSKTVAPSDAKDIYGLIATDLALFRDSACARTAEGMTCWGSPPISGGIGSGGYPIKVPL